MNLLILGANSDVAQAVARKFAREEKARLTLASRDMEVLEKRARDISLRYEVEAVPVFFDATDYSSHAGFYGSLDPKPDGVVAAFGYLGDQTRAQSDFQEAKRIIETNYLGVVSILEIVAADFEKRGHGFIVGISSVAGERGRQSNYVYGSSKAALTNYLSGLRNRLHRRSVSVMTIIPGFIHTKMTDDMRLPTLLTAEPEDVAQDIHKAFRRHKDIRYTRFFWRWIMAIVKAVPEFAFKRLKL
ncbi:MAG: SDR family oxidoreductase [Syntrophobacteraceae bacterium]